MKFSPRKIQFKKTESPKEKKSKSRRFQRRNSFKFEVTALITLVVGIILMVFSCVLYWILSHTLHVDMDNELKIKAETVNQAIRVYVDVRGEKPESLKYAIEKAVVEENLHNTRWWMFGFQRRWSEQLDDLDLDEVYINFASSKKASLFRSKNMDSELTNQFLTQVEIDVNNKSVFKNLNFNDQRIRIINYPVSYDGESYYCIQIGASQRPIVVLLENWLKSTLYSIPAVLILTFFVGQLFASRILSPIQKITSTAKTIADGDLSMRMEAQDYYVEMNYLIDAFNEMIERLERSFHHIEEFSSHVAHELKTPLTIIRGETELASLEGRNTEDYKRALGIILEETENMLTIIEDLLFLSKLDYRPEFPQMKKMDFVEFFREVSEQSRILVNEKKIQLLIDIPNEKIFVIGDSVHLRRLFFNLINNAIKYTPSQGKIQLNLVRKNKEVMVSVKDNGRGINKEDLENIFERFYSSNDEDSGVGLGLNIASTIAKVHKGHIEVVSLPNDGATFQVFLPIV
ncbi:MAG: HAMP domain-containing histidine kinase [Candidatus Omnitrophica bacterium]|nr:HAMP domain-containing histidine kinase [Candidatus Omnitrophota bacterium]MCB9747261.1 HAMP domain-containing histidine kinase [Candidatus Omnitrophota bacterium]